MPSSAASTPPPETIPGDRFILLEKIGEECIFQTERDLLLSTRRAIAYAHALSKAAALVAEAAEAADENKRPSPLPA